MKFQLDPILLEAAARLGWAPRETGNPDEMALGDYAHGYLLLQRPEYIQLARRSERGEPSLKLWGPELNDLQKYLAFNTARLIRSVEKPGDDIVLPIDPATISAPFRLEHDESRNVFLLWNVDGIDHWLGFGRGNEFIATQYSHYAARDIANIVTDALAPTPSFPRK